MVRRSLLMCMRSALFPSDGVAVLIGVVLVGSSVLKTGKEMFGLVVSGCLGGSLFNMFDSLYFLIGIYNGAGQKENPLSSPVM